MAELPGTEVLHGLESSLRSLLERERQLQRELLERAFAPVDAVFDLLEESSAALHDEAQALEHAAKALEQAAGVVKRQAELFERALHTLREPSRMIEAAVGLDADD